MIGLYFQNCFSFHGEIASANPGGEEKREKPKQTAKGKVPLATLKALNRRIAILQEIQNRPLSFEFQWGSFVSRAAISF